MYATITLPEISSLVSLPTRWTITSDSTGVVARSGYYCQPSTIPLSATDEDAAQVELLSVLQREYVAAEVMDKLWWSPRRYQVADALRAAATVETLLCDATARGWCFAVAARGGKSSSQLDAIATPKVCRAAIVAAAARLQRRADRQVADAARVGEAGRIVTEATKRAAARERARIEKCVARANKKAAAARQKMIAGQASRKALEAHLATPLLLEQVSPEADGLVRSIVRAVGTIGEQTERDLRELRTDEDFGGKKGRNHKLTRTTIARVEKLSDWSAVLLTMRDYVSFGSSRWGSGERNYGTRGGSSYRCYLIVRDTTTGESHVLRVPPKYGNSDTQFFGRFRSSAERIRAAVAWTFEREPAEYRPEVEA